MTYYFDTYGWLSDTPIEGRETTIAPPNTPIELPFKWNFTGYEWISLNSVSPSPEVPQETRPNHITKRAFWSRFPAAKETVMRAVRLGAPTGYLMLVGSLDRLNSRVESSPYVNLDDAETIGGLTWLASNQCPETIQLDGQSYPLRLTTSEKNAVLSTIIVDGERYVK
jgi:hypothetical protein